MLNLINKNIKKILRFECDKTYLLLFVGNTFRSDDGVGPYIAENIISPKNNIKILNVEDKPELYIDDIMNIKPDTTIIFDAANFNGLPGEIKYIEEKYINNLTLSTHTFPLGAIAELIKYDTNSNIFFIGIQPINTNLGETLSKEVKKSADLIINLLTKEIKKCMN